MKQKIGQFSPQIIFWLAKFGDFKMAWGTYGSSVN